MWRIPGYGAAGLWRRADTVTVDVVRASRIPESLTPIGYAVEAGLPYKRPFCKVYPHLGPMFMPQVQEIRDLVARMKFIPTRRSCKGKRILFCDDSVVRGTPAQGYVSAHLRLRRAGDPFTARVSAVLYGCKFSIFSRSRSEMDLAARKAIKELEGDRQPNLEKYADPGSGEYKEMGRYHQAENGNHDARVPEAG